MVQYLEGIHTDTEVSTIRPMRDHPGDDCSWTTSNPEVARVSASAGAWPRPEDDSWREQPIPPVIKARSPQIAFRHVCIDLTLTPMPRPREDP